MKRKFIVLMLATAITTLAACEPGGHFAAGKLTETKAQPEVKEDTIIVGPASDPANSEFQITAEQKYFPAENKIQVVFKTNRTDLKIIKVEVTDQNIATGETEEVEVLRNDEVIFENISSQKDLRPWKYNFRVTTDKAGDEQFVVSITQPKDFIVSTHQSISNYQTSSNVLSLRTLTIRGEGVLTIDSKSMTVEVQNFNSEDGGTIQNMGVEAAASSASLGVPGNSGSRVEIKAKQANGHLTLITRGQKGGKGFSGKDVGEEARPPKAGPGTPGKFHLDSDPHKRRCLSFSTNGEPGTPGIQGGTGLQGQRGGSSGSFHLAIESGNLKFQLAVNGGIPGDGGDGGRGGPGGYGGDPDKTSALCRNLNATPGSTGPDGPPGKIGDEGFAGTREESCFRINDTKSCYSDNAEGELK